MMRAKLYQARSSEFDGFAIIPSVPFGTHTARLNPEQLNALGYCPMPGQEISVSQEEPFASLEDYTLYPAPKSVNDKLWLRIGESASLDEQKQKWQEYVDLLSIAINNFGNLQPNYFPSNITVSSTEEVVPDYKIMIGPLSKRIAQEICDQSSEYDLACEVVEEVTCQSLTGIKSILDEGYIEEADGTDVMGKGP